PCTNGAPLRTFLEHFMRGYETENHLDESWLVQVDFFLHYRSALLFTVMQDWLSTKPGDFGRWKKTILSYI
ncbi:MAG: hypothetical protein IH586_22145, partial [Anaerolineaceae bacterium]|nr:hypothetical protein [Anaerolineaceae bacterium]